MLLEYLGYGYLVYIASVILHEVLHLVSALIFHFKIDRVILGNFLYIHIKKLYVSPIILSGAVDVDYESLIKKPKMAILFFYISGIFGNLLMLVFTLLVIDDILLKIWTISVNGACIAFSVLPVIDDNDIAMLCFSLKEKQKTE